MRGVIQIQSDWLIACCGMCGCAILNVEQLTGVEIEVITWNMWPSRLWMIHHNPVHAVQGDKFITGAWTHIVIMYSKLMLRWNMTKTHIYTCGWHYVGIISLRTVCNTKMSGWVWAALCKQTVPVIPRGHWQLNELSSSVQEPPFWQGSLRHSFTSISQLFPKKVWKAHNMLTHCFCE